MSDSEENKPFIPTHNTSTSVFHKIISALAWIDSDMKPWRKFYLSLPAFIGIPIEVIDVLLRGSGQVVLMNNSITGLLIIIGLFIANWWVTLCGLVGLFISTFTAFICGFNINAIRDGLHGYNGFLCGLALATFAEPEDYFVLIPIVITSAMTSVILSFYCEVYQVPACTLPFCIASSCFLLGSYQYSYFPEPSLSPYLSQQLSEPYKGIDISEFFQSMLTGISQIFLASDLWAGCLILIGMAFCSRVSAVMCFLGSSIGLFYAFGLGVDRSDIYFGLWGYNTALSAICIGGMFFKLSFLSVLYACACCIGTAFIQGAMYGMFAPWGIPILTFPFNAGVLLFLVAYPSFTRFGGLEHIPLSQMVTPETYLFKQERV